MSCDPLNHRSFSVYQEGALNCLISVPDERILEPSDSRKTTWKLRGYVLENLLAMEGIEESQSGLG